MQRETAPWHERITASYLCSTALVLCLAMALPATARAEAEAEGGVVVEEVGADSALGKAGIRPSDILLSWERLASPPANPEPARGEIESPFGWLWLELEQAPRGTVKLTGRRGEEALELVVAPGFWEAEVRPRMSQELLEDYLRHRELLKSGKIAQAASLWQKVVAAARNWRMRCWLWLDLGKVWAEQSEWEKAHTAYHSGIEEAQGAFPESVLRRAIGAGYIREGKLELARQVYNFVREIRRNSLGAKSLALAESVSDLGELDWRVGRFHEAREFFQHSLEIREELAPGSLHMAQSLNELGVVADYSGDLERAADLYQRALKIQQELAPDTLIIARSLVNLGYLASLTGRLEQAADLYQRALKIQQELAPDSLDVATSLDHLAGVAEDRGDLSRAADFLNRALKIQKKLAPGSLHMAGTLNNLGKLALTRGELDRAADFLQRALEIREELAPGSLDVAAILSNLGSVARKRGHLDEATDLYQHSLRIRQELAPGSLEMANGLNNLGAVHTQLGNLDKAADLYQRALEIRQKLASGSLSEATSLYNLGWLAWRRGDLDRAADYLQRALEIQQKQAPDSLRVANSIGNLGSMALDRKDLDRAEELHQRALSIRQNLAPDSLDVAISLNYLGSLARERGELDRAADFFQRALEIREELAPDGLDLADSLSGLGSIARERGDVSRATDFYQRALVIRRQLAPDSAKVAETLYALGLLQIRRDRPNLTLADEFFRRALHTLEKQFAKLGGSHDVRVDFRAQYDAYYRDALKVQLQLGQPDTAFHTLERSRARSFLEQLAERDLVFSGIPEVLERQRRRFAWGYDKTQDEIANPHPREQAEEIDTLRSRLGQLRRDYEDVTEKIVKASPRLGGLRYPQPLELEAARRSLDPGTVMLSYSVGKDETHLFIVTREEQLRAPPARIADSFTIKTLPLSEEELRGEVERVLKLQKRRSAALLYTRPLRDAGERLYRALIQPAEELIASRERVLLVPDGPLHLLPFALLVRRTDPGKPNRDRDFEYLVEWKPLHTVLSATVYAELKKQRRRHPNESKGLLALAAFGDPQFPFENSRGDLDTNRNVDVFVRAAAERGFDFSPLPYSREEVRRIVALYPGRTARAFLGVEASEERAKSVGSYARILHFATHGRFDDRVPLNSYLALTTPEQFREDQDNGLLQAWEIFEEVRLDADLVVLSACKSGVGEQIDGEGLKGLTQAFQFAGARTVASSLWQVDDQATAELMQRFYRHLRSGKTKDEALRAAQLELIRGPVEITNRQGEVEERDLSLPYYWAAFQLIGDWR